MVRSGMTTSFCATTLVTPSLVAVFMMKKREKEEKWGSKKECRVLARDKKKSGATLFGRVSIYVISRRKLPPIRFLANTSNQPEHPNQPTQLHSTQLHSNNK